MSTYILIGFATLVLSALFMFLVLRFAHRKSLYDQIDERKVHTELTPRLGGVGFISAYMFVVLVLTVSGFWNESVNLSFGSVLLAMMLILVFGIWDDLKPLRARYKFGIQCLAALLIVVAGYGFRRLSLPELGWRLELGFIRYPLTILWIVGIINAINLIDGIDGLAGGLSFIILLCYSLIYLYLGDEQAFLLCVLLIAAIGGFLIFNAPVPRAKIFMGDTGSQFLGFFIAIIPFLESSKTESSAISLPFAAGITLIPIFDTFAAIWRRIRDGMKIYEPDRKHTHHKLLALGLNAIKIDLVLYTLQIVVGASIVLSLTVLQKYKTLLVVFAYGLVSVFFTILHFMYFYKTKHTVFPRDKQEIHHVIAGPSPVSKTVDPL